MVTYTERERARGVSEIKEDIAYWKGVANNAKSTTDKPSKVQESFRSQELTTNEKIRIARMRRDEYLDKLDDQQIASRLDCERKNLQAVQKLTDLGHYVVEKTNEVTTIYR